MDNIKKLWTIVLKSHNGFKQTVSTRIKNGIPEMTSRSGRYKEVTGYTITGSNIRNTMQISALIDAYMPQWR